MEALEEHYGKLLGLQSPWVVDGVGLSLKEQRVSIEVVYRSENGPCPVCGAACAVYDHQARRTWRHLDTMQFEPLLSSRTPRVRCAEHGVLNLSVPWAAKLARVELRPPSSAIGRDTVQSLQSGLLLGYVGLVEGMVARFRAELGPGTKVIATGGLAPVIARETKVVGVLAPWLTLDGLRILYELNRGRDQ